MAAASRTVRVHFDGDTTGLATAAKNGERIVDRFADNASRTVTSRFRAWFTGRGATEGNTIGRFFARTFGSGMLQGFTVPVFGPALLAVLLAVVATVAPIVGAALAAGIVAAFGAGIVGLGVVFAAQSERVKAAFTDLGDSLAAQLRTIAHPFEDTLVQIAGFMERTFASFRPILADAFAGLAPIVTSFADQFFSAVERFKPAVTAISDAFGDLLGALGPKLPALFDDVADTIENIATTVSENADAFADLITFFVDAADKALEFVGALADAFVWLREQSEEGFFTAPFAEARAEIEAMLPATEAAATGFGNYTTSIRSTIQALEDYAAAQQAITDPMFALINAATRADEAQSAYNEAVKEFGAASPEAASAAVAAAEAVASLEQAALSGDVSFAGFESKLRQWVASGKLTAAQADVIRERVAGARGEAEDFQGTYQATMAVRDRASAALRGIREWLDSIQSKTITITARSQIPAGVSVRQLMEAGRAAGGPVVSGRSYLVGEKGPEILTMGRESGNIIPNHQLDRATGGSIGGGLDERTLGRALRAAIDGALIMIDDRGRGHLIARQADMYARAG